MKIVHVITRLLRAGAEENTLATCKYQLEHGHEVYVFHGKEFDQSLVDELPKELKIIAVPEMIHPVAPTQDLKAIKALKLLYKDIRPDVVHTHHSKAGVLGRIAAVRMGMVVVHTVHIAPFINVSPVQKAIYVVAEKAAARSCDAIISVSAGMRDAYLEHKIGKPSQHYVVHSGMELDRFEKAQDSQIDKTELFGDSGSKFIVLMLAAFEPRKRQEKFLEAAAPMLRRNPDVYVVFCGEGVRRQPATELVEKLQLSDQVLFTGFQPNPEDYILASDVCILTSEREGLPRVLVQYTAAGKPTIVNKLLGISDVIKNGVSGIVVPEDDMSGVADQIERLKNSPELLATLSDGAKQVDVSGWSVNRMGSEIQRVYDQYISS